MSDHSKNKYNNTPEEESEWAVKKRQCWIRRLCRKPDLARKEIGKLNNKIKRNAEGVIAKKDLQKGVELENFRKELNAERQRLKNERHRQI